MSDNNPSGLRILIVEDEALIAEELRERLARFGFQTAAIVDTAAKAIEALEATRPGLVLMDIRIKGPTDGIEAAHFIRTHFKLPVIFLTAHSDSATLKRAKLTAPFGYVLKPFQERELLVAIEMATTLHSLERHLDERTAELQHTVAVLQRALAEVKTLRGLVPICGRCKKVRDAAGDWKNVDTWLGAHTEAEFTHGYCPECYEREIEKIDRLSRPE